MIRPANPTAIIPISFSVGCVIDCVVATGVDDTGADVIFYGATSGRNMKWDESEDHLLFTDNTKLKIGTGADLQLYHDSSDSYVRAYNNDLIIMQDAADKDIIFKADDGSGSPTAYLTLDGSVAKTAVSKPLLFADNISAEYGADTDMIMYHSGGAGYIEHYTGNFNIIQHTNDGDIIFQCDDGSGGVTTYITIDGSATQTKFDKNARFSDSVRAEFGSSGDFVITHDGTDSKIENATGDFKIRNFSDDKDIIFDNDNGAGGSTTYFKLDGSLATHDGSATTALHTVWPDLSRVSLGSSTDLQLYHSGTNSLIANFTGDLYIQNDQDDGDIFFRSDDGSGSATTYIQIDGGNTDIDFLKNTHHLDNVYLKIGSATGGDLQIYHNGSHSLISNQTGDLYIRNQTDDGDIIFQADDGSGGDTDYVRIDGANSVVTFSKDFKAGDTVKANFGAASDLQIYHDGSNSYIDETGTGSLYIKSAGAIRLQSDTGENMIYAVNDGAVNLYHNNVKKVETTSAGITVTGNIVLSDDGTIGSDSDTDAISIDDSGVVTFSSRIKANVREFEVASGSAGDAKGDIVYFGSTTSMTAGSIYHYKSDGTWELADASAVATCDGLLAVALGAASNTNGMLLRGMATLSADPGAVGDVLFVSETAGRATATAPTTNNAVVRVVGYCLHATNGNIWFNPDGTFVEVTA